MSKGYYATAGVDTYNFPDPLATPVTDADAIVGFQPRVDELHVGAPSYTIVAVNLGLEITTVYFRNNGAAGLGPEGAVTLYGTTFTTVDVPTPAYGAAYITGSAANESLYANVVSGFSYLNGGAGDDLILSSGNRQTLVGGPGADTFSIFDARTRHTIADFESGIDKLEILNGRSNITLDLSRAGQSDFVFADIEMPGATLRPQDFSTVDRLSTLAARETPVESAHSFTVFGSTRSVTITGLGNADSLSGSGEDDVLAGAGGNDRLYGGAGDDWIDGGPGDDIIDGGAGRDTLYGGTGADTFVFTSAADSPLSGADSISDFQTGSDKLDFTGLGSGASVAFDLGEATTTVYFQAATGPQGAVTLWGGQAQAADLLLGPGATLYLAGTAAGEQLIAETEKDVLTGRGGADTFVFGSVSVSPTSAADLITDFDPNQDFIDLSGIDADIGTTGQQHFTLAAVFTHAAGQLVATDTGSGLWRLDGDANGDGVADFTLQVQTTSAWNPYQGPSHLLI